MRGVARPRGGRWGKATTLFALLSTAAWAQQFQIPEERFPGIKLDVPSAGALCNVCGEIRSIREIHVGPVAPANPSAANSQGEELWVVGNVLALPFGPGKDNGPRVGTAGTPEMNARFAESSFEIAIRMDNGERRTLQRRDGNKFQVGDRVTMRSGQLELMVPR
jgi:outer membrane lipoprotein SlyB